MVVVNGRSVGGEGGKQKQDGVSGRRSAGGVNKRYPVAESFRGWANCCEDFSLPVSPLATFTEVKLIKY